MSEFEYVRSKLQSKAQSLYAIARGSGVPFSTVQRIASGQTPSPRIDTVEKLAGYFRAGDAAVPRRSIARRAS